MPDLWKLVVNTAIRENIQVFATTHSLDCLRGLATLLEEEPQLAGEVSLQKIEGNLAKSIAFSGEEIRKLIDAEIEVR